MFDYHEGNVKVNGIKLHYYRTGGNKPPLVLLHGATDSGLCWTPVAVFLQPRHDVIMVDAQGHGFSDRLDSDFAFSNHTHQIIGLINELRLGRPIIMGHSMGAGTAVNIAVEQPELPKAIILEDPAWHAGEDMAAENSEEMIKQREAFMEAPTGYGQRTLDEIIEEGRKNNPTWSEAEIIPWAMSKLQFDPELFSKLHIDRPTYEELVPKIDCPTLLIMSDGGLVNIDTAEKAASIWKSDKPFKWVQITGAGHNIRREQFGKYRETLLDFLDSLTTS